MTQAKATARPWRIAHRAPDYTYIEQAGGNFLTVAKVTDVVEPCPLHFGLGYSLICVGCLAMPTIMPDGSLRDSIRAATTEELRRWATVYQEWVARQCKYQEK
jgi:hypothetical protein